MDLAIHRGAVDNAAGIHRGRELNNRGSTGFHIGLRHEHRCM